MIEPREATPSGNVLAFLAGALAGAFAVRVLPPVIAQLAGAMRDPFDDLTADHRHFVRLLRSMEESGPDEPVRRTALLLRLKRGLAAHAMAEEDVVYPLLHDEAEVEEEAKQLYDDHGDIKIHMYALERMRKDDPAWRDRVRRLRMIIEDHARQEETIEFPRLRRVLRDGGMTRMAADVQREKSLIL